MQLLSNNRQGAPVQTTYTTSSQKRSIKSVDEEEDLEVECSSEAHDVLPLSQYIAEVRQRGHMSKHQRMHGSAARCSHLLFVAQNLVELVYRFIS